MLRSTIVPSDFATLVLYAMVANGIVKTGFRTSETAQLEKNVKQHNEKNYYRMTDI